MKDTGVALVLTTFDDPEDAARIGRQLVERKLAACATRLPGALSTYWWEGRLEESAETLVLFKTTPARRGELIAALGELHPYEIPEILSFTPELAGEAYGRWLAAVLG